MNWVTTKRVLRAGFLSFWRNGFVSFASILMMVFTLFVIGLTIFTGFILNSTLEQFRSKADMNVYFTVDAPEDQILALKKSVDALPEVATTTYVTRDEALADFREHHQNDQLTLQSLESLGYNPLPAYINIHAKDITGYPAVSNFLTNQSAIGRGQSQIIYKITDNREIISRLAYVTDSAKVIGLVLIVIFIFATIAITFNTMRLATYASREEIGVMRLVGAGQWYIRAPFIVEGIMDGFIAGVVTLLLFYPLSWWLGETTQDFFGGINVYAYYLSHFPLIFVVMLGSGVLLGGIASFLAVRRYLSV